MPAAHSVHCDEAWTGENEPDGQLLHAATPCELDVDENVPAAHREHAVLPVALE